MIAIYSSPGYYSFNWTQPPRWLPHDGLPDVLYMIPFKYWLKFCNPM